MNSVPEDDLFRLADALRRRVAADEELTRLLGRPVEQWNLGELLAALEGPQAALLNQVDHRSARSSCPQRATDPENRHPGWGLLPFEELAERLIERMKPPPLVTRTREAIQLDWKGEKGGVVLLTPEVVQVRIPRVEWLGPHEPRQSSRIVHEIPISEATGTQGLIHVWGLVQDGVRKRRSQYRKCRFCGESLPPEHGFDKSTCNGCAGKHLGVIH